jgi:2-aminoadipate transaminase
MSQMTSVMEAGIRSANWTQALQRTCIQDMLVECARPGILSFALGLPAAELFPASDYLAAVARVLTTDPQALQYGPPSASLKQHIVRLMERRGIHCNESQVFLTAGSQQSLNLLTRLLLDPGGSVVTEELTYPGFLQALQPYQPEVLTVRTCLETGIDVDAVERLLEKGGRPAMIYVMAEGHNPLTVSMSRAKRVYLVELARRYCVPVIEDDAYGFLHYEGAAEPPLRAFDDEWVIYAGTFSKVLAPGLRTGWMIVPEALTSNLSTIKEATDINTTTLNQRAISDYLEAGHLAGHIAMLRHEYRLRRDAMLAALEVHLPHGAAWHKPQAGLFIWVELPDGVDTRDLLRAAIDHEKVAFIPGHAFNASRRNLATNCMRLNFSNSSVEGINDGIARLARVLQNEGRQMGSRER